jgi:hypothetical protein
MKITTTAPGGSKGKGEAGSSTPSAATAAAPLVRTGHDKWLEGSDFTEDETILPQACTLLFGDAGTGKTTYATRFAPDPVAFINFDGRAAHAVKYAREQLNRKILFTRIDFPGNITKLGHEQAVKLGQAAVDKTIRNLEFAIRENQKGNVKTICLDTGTEYTELIKIAVTGRIDRVKGDFGKSKDLINREWWRVFNMVRESAAHLVILARGRAIWENNEPTGKFTYRGADVMSDGVDWAGHIRLRKGRISDSSGGGKKKAKEFEIEVTKAGVNITQLGEVYRGDDWADVGGPFVWANLMNYPGSDPEDWGG